VKPFEKSGWKYKESFGTPGVAALAFHIEGEGLLTMTGFWVEKGIGHEQEFKQDREWHCIFHFEKTDGDSFLIILSKEKLGNEPK